MKRIISNILSVFLIVSCMSCQKDEETPAATADFSYSASNLSVAFANQSTNSRYFSWNFGDDTEASTAMSPTHSYEEEGTYNVSLTTIGRDGTTQTKTQAVTVTAPLNLVNGGKMNTSDASAWTNITYSSGVTFAIENGKMLAKGGGWGHAGIYQKLSVVAGKTYVLDMTISGGGAEDTWFEVYVGQSAPGTSDYTDGGKRLAFSTWCYGNNKPFEGLFSLQNISCDAKGKNIISFAQSGDVYLVIRGGGSNLGSSGISIDNITLTEKQ